MSSDGPAPTGQVATRFEIDDNDIAWLTLNRPEAANARNQQMRDELGDVYRFLAGPTRVRVLVLAASGDRHFCAGMDLKEAGGPETSEQRRRRLERSRDIDRLAELPLPTIAEINGVALGGGLEMALACDLRIVAEEASMGLPELTHGLVPGGGGTQRLPRLIGAARTLELLYLARRITGAEAVAIGLATRCVPRARLREETRSVALRIAELPAAAVLRAKELVRASAETPLSIGLGLELDALLALMDGRA